MKEGANTKYERGESPITIKLVQKVATALEVNPISILAASPDNFIETIQNSPLAGMGNSVGGDYNALDPKQFELMNKLMEKLIELLGRRE